MTPEEQAKYELLERIRPARGLLSQASGWVRALAQDELKPYGIDIKVDVADSLEDVVRQLDEIIDMLNGNRVADAYGLYRHKLPEVKRYTSLANLLWKAFSL